MFSKRSAFLRSLFIMVSLAIVMLLAVVRFDAAPHIPMLFGAALAGAMAMISGKSWEEVEDGMIKGIGNSLSSLVILLLIGVLMGVWILDGVVPAMVYYGLSIISPTVFLPSAMVLCALLSMVVGSWGTVGTIGLALAGLSQAMDIPLPVTVGAIVSGAYLGDRISPLSDTANLSSAITGVDIFKNVTYKIFIPLGVQIIAAAVYFIIGLRFHPSMDNLAQMRMLQETLAANFNISPLSFIPLILLVTLMIFRFPAVPSIVISIITSAAQCMIFQGISPAVLLETCMNGFTSSTGNQLLDTLLSAGGLNSMLYSLSMIICAMMFGGIMEHTGQMEALMTPLLKHLKGFGNLIAATVGSCILVNIFIPEEYISISIPGCLFLEEYDKQGISRTELAYTIGAGGSATSSLIPWNTCGVFISGVLGISALAYAPFAFYNLLLPVLTIAFAYIRPTALHK